MAATMLDTNAKRHFPEPIAVEGDSRVRRCSATINGKTYGELTFAIERALKACIDCCRISVG